MMVWRPLWTGAVVDSLSGGSRPKLIDQLPA